MPKSMTVTEAVRHFSELIERVRFYDERFVLTKGGKPVAELRPVSPSTRVYVTDLPAILAELPHLESKEAARFADDLAASRRILSLPRDQWDS